MSDTLSCPDCDAEFESAEELETHADLPEVETDDEGSFSLYGNRDLFLCENCKKPLGVSRS